MDILRSQSERAQERYVQCIFGVLSPKALITMTDPRSKIVNARKRKRQWTGRTGRETMVYESYSW